VFPRGDRRSSTVYISRWDLLDQQPSPVSAPLRGSAKGRLNTVVHPLTLARCEFSDEN